MSKTVTFLADVFPYCVGDVQVLTDDELKAIDKLAKVRKIKAYVVGAKGEVDSTDEFDRQEADRLAQVKPAEDAAKVDLEVAASEKAEAEGHASPAGRTVPGTSAGKTVATAAAAGKDK